MEEEIKALPGASLLRPKEVRASHILVKHSGSRRPSSWKEARPDPASLSSHGASTYGPHVCLTAQNHPIKGGGYCNPAGIPGRDRDGRR
jgi:hypothetical protein